MNTHAAAAQLLDAPGIRARARGALVSWRDAIASVGPAPWKWAGLIGLCGTTLECALTFGERDPSVALSMLLKVEAATAIRWAVQMALGLCAWAVADRSDASAERRPRRLAIALGVAVLLQAVVTPGLTAVLLGHVDACVVRWCETKDWSKVPWWLFSVECSGEMLTLGGLIFAWLEVHRRNGEIERRLLAAQQQRNHLLRSAFDARLTAMRAQIDPQFLFESLADVQVAYAADTPAGQAMLDRLIVYLRTALPRLRTEGSTIGAEAELVDAWLAVVAARRHGDLAWHVEVDPDRAGAPFPATVLLPLVQWALADPDRSAREVRLSVRRERPAARLLAQLRVAPGRPCAVDEPAPRRIRERLQALYGEAAQLSCSREAAPQGAAGHLAAAPTVITLYWPDESADRDRR